MEANLSETFRRTTVWQRQHRRSQRLYERLAIFARPRTQRVVFAVALALVAPAVATGFCLDDYLLLAHAKGASPTWAGRAPFDLFRFMDPAHNAALMDGRGMPWWALAQSRMAFLRPIASLSHMFDYWLWPRAAVAMHLHNLLWFALLLVLTAKAYRALIEQRWVTGLAFAMFALSSAHGVTVGWIANRDGLIGSVFAVAALLFHHRAREEARRRYTVAAASCFGMGLFSAELAVGAFGFLISYAVFLDRASLKRRMSSLAPCVAVLGAWACVRALGRYGAYALSGYVDPIREPVEFIRVLPARLALYFASQSMRLSSDLYESVSSDVRRGLVLAACVCCVALAWFIAPVLRRDAVSRFWFGGAILAAVPLAASGPSDRVLTLVGFGVMPVLAKAMSGALASQVFASGVPAREQRWRLRVATLFAFVHLVIDPLALPLASVSPALIGSLTKPADESLTTDPSLADKTVIVANVPGDSLFLTYLPVIRDFNGKPVPKRLHWLMANHASPTTFQRLGSNVLRVSAPGGVFEPTWLERNERAPMRVGDRVELSEFTATVVQVLPDGRASVCDFEFAGPLEAERYVWLDWRDGRLEPLTPPKVGESITLTAS